MRGDFPLLLKATIRIYKKALTDSAYSFKRCWKYLFFHLLIMLVSSFIVTLIASLFPGMAGGLIIGLFLSFAVSCYLSSISSAFSNDIKSFNNLVQDGLIIFSSVISIFFFLFILSLLLYGFSQLDNIMMFINLVLAVLLNPITEVVQLRPSSTMEMLRDSFEFVRDNIVEWFFPQIVIILAIFIYSQNLAKYIFLLISSYNPLKLLEYFLTNIIQILLNPLLLIIIVFVYFLMIFRLNLFKSLSYSSRRKRIYTERNQ